MIRSLFAIDRDDAVLYDNDDENNRREGVLHRRAGWRSEKPAKRRKTPSANRRFEETIGTGSGSERHTNKPTTNIKMMTGLVTQNHDAHQFLTCSGAAEKQPAVSSIA